MQTRVRMYAAALLVSSFLALVSARIYERCELARDLLKLGVRRDHIATWVCIAYHESRFDTAARNPSSGDHGLLQISEIYWCGAGKACGLPCSALRDDDISDDVECALSIYEEHTRLQGNGFLAWVVYPHYCKHYAKKYLDDCNMSLKDTSYKSEGRARPSYEFNFYPTVNVNFSNPVQSVTYPKGDEPKPLFLSVVSLLRGKYEQDFERDYNRRPKVNWSRFKIDNVDDLKIPDFNKTPDYGFLSPLTTPKPTTFMTTLPSEPQYKPVKPWRIIETNQFRRRMKISNKIFTENNKSKSLNENSFVSSTLRPTTIVGTSINIHNSHSIITVPTRNVFEENTEKSKATCCETTPFATTTPFTTPKLSTPYSSATTRKIYSTSQIHYSNEASLSNKTEKLQNKIKTFWENYSHLTTKSPDLKSISYTENPMKSHTTLSQHALPQSDMTGISERSYLLTTKVDKNQVNALDSDNATSKGKETLYTTLSTNQFTTSKPQSFNSTTIETWRRHRVQNNERLTANILEGDEKPDNSQKSTWSNSSFPEPDQNQNERRQFVTPLTTTPRNLPSSTNSLNITYDAKSTTTVKNILSDTAFKVKPTIQPTLDIKTQVTTENTIFTSPSIPKKTLSIFDLYLNPTKRPQIPNYKFLFSNNFNAKIFSGGTTPSPGKKNIP
ncbi:uncharacterized protein [Battus philenor]|uniref:uncharacterized protein n=1 Tax=Battus philenor TaxID=42288 RepID=UPI0035D1254F